jgi:hypothetical protein
MRNLASRPRRVTSGSSSSLGTQEGTISVVSKAERYGHERRECKCSNMVISGFGENFIRCEENVS